MSVPKLFVPLQCLSEITVQRYDLFLNWQRIFYAKMKDFLNYAEQQRLIEAIFSLKSRKLIRSLSDLCVKCGKNKSYFNDVRTKNLNFSSDFIKRVFELYPINEQYVLTGNGEILLSADGATAQTKEVNAQGGVVQNIANNGNGNVEANANTAPSTEPTFAEVLQQLVATNAKLVETNAQLVAMLNNK